MYNNHHTKKIFFLGFMIGILLPYQAFGFDLFEEIDLKIQSIYDGGSFDEYLNRSYYSEFSKDPFGDAMADISDLSNKMKKSGEDYVKKSLNFDGCSLSNKEIRGILYYYVPEYKTDIVRSLKIEQGKYDSWDYVLDSKTVKKYCEKLNNCGIDLGSANLETKCKEFFQKNYKAGEYNELIKQNIQVSWLGTDKYRNNTTDDSPYDVIEDLGILSKLLYQEAQDPIKPVFYDIPAFSKSKEEATQNRETSKSSDSFGMPSDNNGKKGDSFGGRRNQDNGSEGTEQDNQGDDGNYSEPSFGPQPLGPNEILDYDNLLEGLGAYRLANDGTDFYTDLCDNREEQEVEIEEKSKNDVKWGDNFLELDDLKESQYQEVVNYMVETVDGYLSLSSGDQEKIDKKVGDMGDIRNNSSVQDPKTTAQRIKDCWNDSCYGLGLRHIDEMASCMVKCSCGEWSSASIKLFNPDDIPGLGPIFLVRFCAVPAVNTKFSVGGKRIHSVEEGVREIYGVVDKLSREGRLGTWTQQYEFLDASTKRINFADSFAFSIDVEFVNIGNRRPKQSKQYQEKELKNDNVEAQKQFGVKNSTDTENGKNKNRIISDDKPESVTASTQTDIREADEVLNKGSSYTFDVSEDIKAIHNVNVESYWDLWLDQQGELRKNVSGYIASLKSSATLLKDSKKKCKR